MVEQPMTMGSEGVDVSDVWMSSDSRCRHRHGDGSVCNMKWRDHLTPHHGFDEPPIGQQTTVTERTDP